MNNDIKTDKAPFFLEITDTATGELVFKVDLNGEITYRLDSKLRKVQGDDDMIKAMEVFTSWVSKNYGFGD